MKCAAVNRGVQESRRDARVREQALQQTINTVLTVLVYVLADKYGYGNKKIRQIVRTIEDVFDSVCRDYVTLDGLAGILKEEYNLELGWLKRKGGEN